MARRLRIAPGGLLYHVLNRAAGRMTIFRKAADYEAFEKAIEFAHQRVPIGICGYVAMPNHFHLALLPARAGQLSDFMRLLTVTHTNRWHAHHRTIGTGPLYQGRFKSFPIEQDEHALTVLRYIDRNPLRANLVQRAEQWRWSSVSHYLNSDLPGWLMKIKDWPVNRRADWVRWVNAPQTAKEQEAIRQCIARGRPFGSESWTKTTVKKLGLSSSLRPRGRPRRIGKPS